MLERLRQNGFVENLSDLRVVAYETYEVKCNWKVFVENYGDGCYHCGFAHTDLASNIDETNYSTELLSSDLSIQQAPPSDADIDERFGAKTAIYAQLYPNIMLNRYGPWLDIDLIIPVDVTTSKICKFYIMFASLALVLSIRSLKLIMNLFWSCFESCHFMSNSTVSTK